MAADRVAFPLYVFVQEHGFYVATDEGETVAMYRLACRECGEAFEEDERSVPSRLIRGGPLVHEECAGE